MCVWLGGGELEGLTEAMTWLGPQRMNRSYQITMWKMVRFVDLLSLLGLNPVFGIGFELFRIIGS